MRTLMTFELPEVPVTPIAIEIVLDVEKLTLVSNLSDTKAILKTFWAVDAVSPT